MPYPAELRVTLPQDALPTISGAMVQKIEPGIAWAVTVDLDVARARDIKERQEVTVVPTPASRDARPVPVNARSTRGGCPLTLELSQSEARSGDRVDGSLRVEPEGDVTASEARVELVREEKFGNTAKNQVVDQVTFERDLSLQSGDEREWSFSLDVGRVSVPSLKTEKSSVRWLVRAVLDRSLRTDPKVEQEIDVGF